MGNQLNIMSGLSRMLVGTASTDVLPALTVAFNGTWGGTWRDVGYLEQGGVTVAFNQAFTAVQTSQSRTPVLQLPGASTDTMSAAMLETTLQNIQMAAGRGTLTTLAPVGATPGSTTLTLSDATAATYVAIAFEGMAPPNNKGNPRRIYFPNAQPAGTISYNQQVATPSAITATFNRLGGTGNDAILQDILTS